MRGFPSISLGVLVVLALFTPLHSTQAAVVATGDVGPLPVVSIWDPGYVGQTTEGSLTIDGGDLLSSRNIYVGHDVDASGNVTVTGEGSRWYSLRDLYVGYAGTGSVAVGNGGYLLTDDSYTNEWNVLGYEAGSTGEVTVGGAGSTWESMSRLQIGYLGSGIVTVSDGGAFVTSDATYLGYELGSFGGVTVSGAGSTFTTDYGTTVGYRGTGVLTINDGASYSGGAGVGFEAGSIGEVIITGEGSTWYGLGNIGCRGTGSVLVADGGAVDATEYPLSMTLGQYAGSSGTFTVRGEGSSLIAQLHDLSIGDGGHGAFEITDGATVELLQGYSGAWPYLGRLEGSVGEITVSGAGSQLLCRIYPMYVGYRGDGKLTIAGGGSVVMESRYGDSCFIAAAGTSTGEVTVTGAGSTWTMDSLLVVGDYGSGKLAIADGGAVNSQSVSLGDYTGTGEAVVNGAGSTWTLEQITVGVEGHGKLAISGGGNVVFKNPIHSYPFDKTHLGYASYSLGEVAVSGAGSAWTGMANLCIGYEGTGKLIITNGGRVASGESTETFQNFLNVVGEQSGGYGEVTVSGAGSTWDYNGQLLIRNGKMIISDGGTVVGEGGASSSYDPDVGIASTYNSTAEVIVSGAGSRWTIPGKLQIGYSTNSHAVLAITDGGLVSNNECDVYPTSEVLVSGPGSKWMNAGDLRIAAGAKLAIENGGAVECNAMLIGTSYAPLAEVTVAGVGSTLFSHGVFQLAGKEVNKLNITDGGFVTTQGNASDNISNVVSSGEVLVSGLGSTWLHGSDLFLGYGSGGAGAVTVSGPGATWINAGNLFVGRSGSGSVAIDHSAAVNVVGMTFLGFGSPSGGQIAFGPGGGTLATGGLCAAPSQLGGTGTIYAFGLASDVDLTLDSPASLVQTFHFTDEPDQDVTVHLDMTRTEPAAVLGAGYRGSASLVIRDGMAVSSRFGFLGVEASGVGTATVTGAGSSWTCDELLVGYYGTGTLVISDGGTVVARENYSHPTYLGTAIGKTSYSSGSVVVLGADSTFICEKSLTIGAGNLKLVDGATATIGETISLSTTAGTSSKIIFGPGGGTLSAAELSASPWQLAGTGDIHARGLISDLDLTFDGPDSLKQTILFNSEPEQAVSLHLDMSDPETTWGLGVGRTSHGSLTIRNGANVYSKYGRLGSEAGSNGVATITGAGSTWSTKQYLYVGRQGNGTLAILDGATVANEGLAYVGYAEDVAGKIVVSGPSSSWTNQGSIYLGHSGTGTIDIRDGGTVTSQRTYLGYDDDGFGSVTVSGNGSLWTVNGYLDVGYFGEGKLVVSEGGAVAVDDHPTSIGSVSGSHGAVVVRGAGSTWTSEDSIRIGMNGDGTLTIADGGAVSNDDAYIGYSSFSSGTVVVRGAGSSWTNAGDLDVGYSNNGSLTICGGGSVSSENGHIGRWSSSASGKVLVDGPGSLWQCDANLEIGTSSGNGKLTIANGGAAAASLVKIGQKGRLTLDVNGGSQLSIAAGSGDIDNDGTVRLVAGAGPSAGGVFTPILAATWTGDGVCQAVGGTWDSVNQEFTVSNVVAGVAGTAVSLDRALVQRVLIDDARPESDWRIGASFLAAEETTALEFTATVLDGEPLDALEALIQHGQTVRGAWALGADEGYTPGEPVYLSLDTLVPTERDHLSVWQYDGATWSEADAWDLTYDGTYASFMTESMSTYALIAELLPGDANDDGVVDGADARLLAAHWLSPGGWADGDFNGDSTIDDLDASILAANWTGTAESQEVPEPGSMALLLSLAGLILLRRGRGR
ncbi:MAG: PEP-CTERM sorting domain-containing protein [Pirellulales bacterium]|nr:PEP-CTERM sorting domain-containing protein [Pirellulales bacterium]